MREVMNPESALHERFESLTREAAELRHRLDTIDDADDREAVELQLRETEEHIERLRKRARGF